MKPAPFAYAKAGSVEDALALLAEHGDGARLLAGGQSLIATLNMRLSALKSGQIAHAALDVYHAEPLAPDHPLTGMENVTLSAHAAFRTLEASMTLLRRAIDIVRTISV